METSFNRWKVMLMDTYYKIHVGLEILATSVYCEVDGEWRVFDNRVIIWLVDILLMDESIPILENSEELFLIRCVPELNVAQDPNSILNF